MISGEPGEIVEAKPFPVDVVEYLRLHHVVTLGTSSFTGMPHADTVIFLNDEWRLYFFALEDSTLLRNTRASHHASFTIDDYTTDWRKVRELQGVGRCDPATVEEDQWAGWLASQKFGAAFGRPPGVLLRILPIEMHFVDYDYATVTAPAIPQMTERFIQTEGLTTLPSHGAVSSSLDQLRFDAGQVIFRPGDLVGEYFVVVQGEVEIRGEGFGADQTVVRVGPGQIFGDQAALRGRTRSLHRSRRYSAGQVEGQTASLEQGEQLFGAVPRGSARGSAPAQRSEPAGDAFVQPAQIFVFVPERLARLSAAFANALGELDHLVNRLLAVEPHDVVLQESVHVGFGFTRPLRQHLGEHRQHDLGPAFADQRQGPVEIEQHVRQVGARPEMVGEFDLALETRKRGGQPCHESLGRNTLPIRPGREKPEA